MPSPAENETQPKNDSVQTTERDPNQPPPPTPQSEHQSCPPVMGYPGYPQATYPNYPNPAYNQQQYAYAQAPPASYYGSSYPQPQQNPVYHKPDSFNFFRGILTGLIFLLVLLCISTTVTYLILRPQIPVFSVTKFSVSNFNVTGPVFSAQWTTNITVENTNTKLKGYFDRIQGFIYNKEAIAEDQYLATAFFQPVYVETTKTMVIGETITAGEKEQPKVATWVTEEMKKERDTGTVSFNLRLAVGVTFKTDGWTARERGLKVFCGKLEVVFDGSSGNGDVSLPQPLPCLVYF